MTSCPMCQAGDPCQDSVKVWKLRETAIALIFTLDRRARLLEHQTPSCLGKELSTEICKGWMSYFAPLGAGELLDLHEIHSSGCKQNLSWCTIAGLEHIPLKEERRWSSWTGISCPLFTSSHLIVLPPLANMYVTHN